MNLQGLRKALNKILPKSKYARGVITLMTGTGIAQALPIALSPVLTRLYTPDDFGFLALYASICAILTVLVTGKYEFAIVIAKYDSEAINLAVLTVMLSLLISVILFGIIVVCGDQVATLLEHPEIEAWLYLVPFTTLILGIYHALNYWTNRMTRYKAMAVSKIVQSGTTGAAQLLSGLYKFGAPGLIWGQIVGQLLSTLFLASSFLSGERTLLRRVSIKRIFFVARKHMQYPQYMVPGQIMSVGATELPLLLLTVFFGTSVAGLYSLAQRVMTAPLSLVASAVGDVYRQKAAEQYARQGECLEIFLSSLKRLLLFSFFPVLPVLLLGPTLFAFVFGESWRAAGEIATLLSILAFFQTISSPLSSTLLLPGWLRIEFFWQFSRLSLAGSVFYLCNEAGVGYKIAIIAHVCAFSSLYVIHSYLQYRAAKGITA